MAITEQDKHRIDQAVAELYYVHTDSEGHKSFSPFDPDYRDTNDFLIQKAYDLRFAAFQESQTYDPENEVIFTLQDMISEVYAEQVWDIEDGIMRKAGFDPSDDKAEEQISYLREAYIMEYPFDHYLDQDVLVNVMLATDEERNQDFSAVKQQQEALTGQMSKEDAEEVLSMQTGLTFLLQQQGHSMEDLKSLMADFNEAVFGENYTKDVYDTEKYAAFYKKHDGFLSSVCQELDNMLNYMNCVTILAKMSLYQYAEMMKPGKEITFSKDAMVGIFSPWAGGGSMLEISPEKDLVIPSDMVWDAQLEGAELDGQHSLDSVYGLVENVWKPIKSIAEQKQEKKPALDAMIQDASLKAHMQSETGGPAHETQRD